MRVVLAILMLKLCLGCLGGTNIKRTNRLASPAEDTTLTPCENDKVRVRGKCVDPLDKFKEECLAQQKLWVPESKEKPCLSELESDEWACKSLGGTWSSEAKCLEYRDTSVSDPGKGANSPEASSPQNEPDQSSISDSTPSDPGKGANSPEASSPQNDQFVETQPGLFIKVIYLARYKCEKIEKGLWIDNKQTCISFDIQKNCKLFWDASDGECRSQEDCEHLGKVVDRFSSSQNLCVTKIKYAKSCWNKKNWLNNNLCTKVDANGKPLGCVSCASTCKYSDEYKKDVCIESQ